MTHLNVVVLSDCALRARSATKATIPNPLTSIARTVELALTLRYLKTQPAHRLSRALAVWAAPFGEVHHGKAVE